MINLLPTDRKDEIKAARANIILLRYMAIIALAVAFIGGALYVSDTVLASTMKNADSLVASNDVKADIYSETKQEVDALSAKLNDTKSILNQEIRYSKVLVKIGQLMPHGTVLGDLDLATANFNGQAIDVTAYAKSTAEAGTLQNQFQISPLFAQVILKSTETKQEVEGYPITVSLSVVLSRGGSL